MKKSILLLLILLASASLAGAQTVFLVRHAERADGAGGGAAMKASDPDLSTAGHARAESLAAMLKDAGIVAIFASDKKRAQQTGAPLAKALGLTVEAVPDTTATIAKVKAAKGNVLIIGHSNTVPEIVKGLGVATPVTIGEPDYDNLFVVTLGPRPTLVRMHFK
jgi:phosphohistidine phosphatase SixA